jgi:hypothetical protein
VGSHVRTTTGDGRLCQSISEKKFRSLTTRRIVF